MTSKKEEKNIALTATETGNTTKVAAQQTVKATDKTEKKTVKAEEIPAKATESTKTAPAKETKVKETAAAAKTSVKKAAPKKAAAKTTTRKTATKKTATRTAQKEVNFYVEYQGSKVAQADIVAKVKEDLEARQIKTTTVKKLDLYAQPERDIVYYVVNAGSKKEVRGDVKISFSEDE